MEINFISVSADSNLSWMKNIRYHVSPTSNTVINSLINKYYLQKTNFSAFNLNSYHTVFFNTDTSINIIPLTKKFTAINGVVNSYPSTSGLDGSDIGDSINPSFTMLIYSYRWADCIIGCLYARHWIFKVYNDCSVEFVKSSGNALPPIVGIKKNGTYLKDVLVFPNPNSGQFEVEFDSDFIDNLSYKLTNTLGQEVLKGTYKSSLGINHLKINNSDLTNDIYILTIFNSKQELHKQKIIKQ